MATGLYIGSCNGSGNNGGYIGSLGVGAQNVGTYIIWVAVSNQSLPGSITNVVADGGGYTPAPGLYRIIHLTSAYSNVSVYGGLVTTSFSSAIYTLVANADTTGAASIIYTVTPSSGRTLLSPVLNANAAGNILNISLTTTVALNSGDVVFGIGGYPVEKSGGVTGDTDTLDGSWEAVGSRLMPSGSWTQSQVFAQHKNVTGGANQTWNPTVTASNTGTGVTGLFTIVELRDQPHWGILAQ